MAASETCWPYFGAATIGSNTRRSNDGGTENRGSNVPAVWPRLHAFNLPPSQAIQARQQIAGRLLLLVLQHNLAMVKSNSQSPLTVVSNAVVEEWYEVVLCRVGRL